jgi:N-methylhydantoinase A
VRSIGSGGGSVAFIDDAGLLKVGPRSAGAAPGPICYSRGGKEPTITDANLVLGRMDPNGLFAAGGAPPIAAIREILRQRIGAPLGLGANQAAAAILRISNDRMAGAIRMVSLAKGHDPRDFTLFAFGGAGPLHAMALARELGIPRVLVPGRPGITNALGCVVADLRHDFVRTFNRPLDAIDIADIRAIFTQQAAEGRRLIEDEPIDVEDIRVLHGADMQFIGQTHLIDVPLPSADVTRDTVQTLFETAYFERFQVELPEIRAGLVNLKTSVIGQRPQIDLAMLIDPSGRKATLNEARIAARPVWFDGQWCDAAVYARDLLPIDASFDGPAIIEQMDTTIVIEPGNRVETDADGNLLIHVESAP